ncbi:beta-glucosidase [Rhodococcus sp. P1Y]|nr:beta-glucosidase [Rhodococcus sp. P1Y]
MQVRQHAALLSGRDFWSSVEGAGIRSIVMADGPHGVRMQGGEADHLGFNHSQPATCFPPGAGLASSWDPDLMCEVGKALGREARSLGVDVLLGPAINIKRSPLGGRTFEYYSEDPRLTGELAVAFVRGVQGTGVGTSVKHFAVNSQETDRMRVNAVVDERALREIYLSAFEYVVKNASPTSVMSAYNAINGEFCSENRWLLTEILRDEWGFDGLVVSDWGAIKDRVAALTAGLDLEMPGSGDEGPDALVAAVMAGSLDEKLLATSVGRLRRLADRTAITTDYDRSSDVEAHHLLARKAAGESIVLLRNEADTLPLRRGQKIAVLGELAVDPQFQGGGSSHVNPTRVDLPLDEIRDALGAERVVYSAGYSRTGNVTAAKELIESACEAASSADVAVIFVGLYEEDQSEGFDREHLDLPASHLALIDAVAKVAARTVVVLSNGGVVSLEPWHDQVDAIVEGWALGQAVGSAIADVLTGTVNPSGRLAETIPMALSDTPAFLNFPGEQEVVRYGESVFVGYRYYTSTNREVRYPFGHGLSYTTFVYSDPDIVVTASDAATARVTVRNDGQLVGSEVVQLYIAPAPSDVRRPIRELAAFDKVALRPGESRTLSFDLDRRVFAHWDASGSRWWVDPGTYELQLARSASDIAYTLQFRLDGDVEGPSDLTLDSTVKKWFEHPVVGPLLLDVMAAKMPDAQRGDSSENSTMLKMVESMSMGQFARFPGVDLSHGALDDLLTAAGQET